MQVAVQAAVAQTEARYGRKMLKVEAKVISMVRQHAGPGAEGEGGRGGMHEQVV